jgi:hypothetical protein
MNYAVTLANVKNLEQYLTVIAPAGCSIWKTKKTWHVQTVHFAAAGKTLAEALDSAEREAALALKRLSN